MSKIENNIETENNKIKDWDSAVLWSSTINLEPIPKNITTTTVLSVFISVVVLVIVVILVWSLEKLVNKNKTISNIKTQEINNILAIEDKKQYPNVKINDIENHIHITSNLTESFSSSS